MRPPLLIAAVMTVFTLPVVSSLRVAAPASPSVVPAAASIAPTAAEADAPLAGTYDCQGVEPDGTPYHGVVQIVPNRGSYDVVWTFGTGQQYAGLGVVNGNVLAVSYFTNRPGVVAYTIEQTDKGPRLQGQWTVVGAGQVFKETLTRLSREVKRIERPPEPRPQPAPILRHLRVA